jgi:hypothetical protein
MQELSSLPFLNTPAKYIFLNGFVVPMFRLNKIQGADFFKY